MKKSRVVERFRKTVAGTSGNPFSTAVAVSMIGRARCLNAPDTRRDFASECASPRPTLRRRRYGDIAPYQRGAQSSPLREEVSRGALEGQFLSSGIICSADHTMELVIDVARR